jgi:phosphoribosyl 1,2-cyclic phosphate phosphodiesterase
MKIHFLGTGGASLTPRPGCECRVCTEARANGPPYSRWGPSLFIEDEHILIDTPEEISLELNRGGINRVDHVFYTHWHPDHTSGIRVIEQLNIDWKGLPGHKNLRTTPVYLPPQVRRDFEQYLSLMERLTYMKRLKLVTVKEIPEEEPVQVGKLSVEAIQMKDPSLYAYLITEGEKRVLAALDDTRGWIPDQRLVGVDLVVLETGWFEYDLDGKQLVVPEHNLRKYEASFEETLEILNTLQAKRVLLTHIEEMNGRSYDDYLELEKEYKEYKLTFAYDGMTVEV